MGIKVAFVTGPEENMGIKYLSAALRQGGHQPALFFDPQLFNDEVLFVRPLGRMFDVKKKLVRQVLEYQPDLVAFSVFSDFYAWASEVARMIREKTRAPVIFGGIHPTSVPEEVIRQDFVDMVCIGEGEYPLAELADSLASRSDRLDIQNIWFKKDGQVIRNKPRPLLDIEKLPCPDHRIYYRKNPFFRVGYHTMASRGCPFKCTYCCHSILKSLYGQARYYRVRSVQNLMGELTQGLEEFKFKAVRFYDDIFPYDTAWLKEFSAQYKKDINLPFVCYLHPSVVNQERVGLLKQAGCAEIRMGIQTLNPGTRKNILNRLETNQDIDRAMHTIKENRIRLVTENILGLPGQNEEDIVQGLEFYNQNRPARNHFFWLRYYPGLEIEKFRTSCAQAAPASPQSKVFTQGGDTFGTAFDPRLVAALYIFPLLPKRFCRYLIKRKWWRSLPLCVPLWAFNIFANITSGALSDKIQRVRARKRYGFFIGKVLLFKSRI